MEEMKYKKGDLLLNYIDETFEVVDILGNIYFIQQLHTYNDYGDIMVKNKHYVEEEFVLKPDKMFKSYGIGVKNGKYNVFETETWREEKVYTREMALEKIKEYEEIDKTKK